MSNVTRGLAVVVLVAVAGCQQSSTTKQSSMSGTASEMASPAPTGAPAPAATAAPAGSAPVTTASGLRMEDLVVGTGATAEKGKTVSVHYTGWLNDANHTKFDSSLDRGQPFEFALGQGGVIRGWDEGVVGMKVGGKRRLTIPPDLGYGANGTPGGPIPPNATLIFEIQLLDVR